MIQDIKDVFIPFKNPCWKHTQEEEIVSMWLNITEGKIKDQTNPARINLPTTSLEIKLILICSALFYQNQRPDLDS